MDGLLVIADHAWVWLTGALPDKLLFVSAKAAFVVSLMITTTNSNLAELNNNLDKTKIRIYVAYASITVQANSQRTFTYDYSASLVDANIVTNIPVIEWNGLGITVGRSFDDNSTIYLWNNTTTTKDVPVYNMIFYTRK